MVDLVELSCKNEKQSGLIGAFQRLNDGNPENAGNLSNPQ